MDVHCTQSSSEQSSLHSAVPRPSLGNPNSNNSPAYVNHKPNNTNNTEVYLQQFSRKNHPQTYCIILACINKTLLHAVTTSCNSRAQSVTELDWIVLCELMHNKFLITRALFSNEHCTLLGTEEATKMGRPAAKKVSVLVIFFTLSISQWLQIQPNKFPVDFQDTL